MISFYIAFKNKSRRFALSLFKRMIENDIIVQRKCFAPNERIESA